MCVVAHPDDECFAFGGALSLAAERGITTYVVCLTDGQAAKNRGEAASGAELGRIRREEFAASCKVLNVSRYELLDYQDAQLEFVDFSKTAAKLVERIRQFQPDVVITFGGEGALNNHPDHTMVSSLTTAAFHWAGKQRRYPEEGEVFQPRRLFYVTSSFTIPGRPVPLLAPWTVKLDIRAVKEKKFEAFRQHLSQAPLMEQTKAIFAELGDDEYYTLAAAEPPQAMPMLTDLFEGLA